MNIKRKIETAFTQYLQGIEGLDALSIVPGYASDTQAYPICVVHCRDCPRADDLPPGSAEFTGQLVLQVITQIDDEAASPHREAIVTAIEEAMRDVAAMRALLNYPGDDEEDARQAQGFHIKGVHEVGQDGGEAEDRTHIEELTYSVPCADFDCDP